MTSITPYDWIKQISPSLVQQDPISMGHPPPFPWEQFAEIFKTKFLIENLTLIPSRTFDQRAADQLTEGLSDQHFCFSFKLLPMDGQGYLLISKEDAAALLQEILHEKDLIPSEIPDDFVEGFLSFIALEMANAFGQVNFDKNLKVQMHLEEAELPKEDSVTFDVMVKFTDHTCLARIVMSPDFQKKWKEHFAVRTLDLPLSYKLDIPMHLEAGRVELSQQEFADIKPGDFLILDHCTLKPTGEGRIVLTIAGTPLFRGKLKDGNIKVLEYPLYQEVNTPMNTNKAPEPTQDGEHEEEGAQEGVQEGEVEQGAQAAAPEEQPKSEFSIGEIPLSLVVEVGRLNISIKKLLELQPGNVLDLNVHPENGVDLVANGKCIAKGELLQIGETLGVRILDIG